MADTNPTSENQSGKKRRNYFTGALKLLFLPTLMGGIKDIKGTPPKEERVIPEEETTEKSQGEEVENKTGVIRTAGSWLFAPTALFKAGKFVFRRAQNKKGDSPNQTTVILSTKKGFLSGILSSRKKERDAGRKEALEIESQARRNKDKKQSSSFFKQTGGFFAKNSFSPFLARNVFKKILPKNKRASAPTEILTHKKNEKTMIDYVEEWINQTLNKTSTERFQKKLALQKILKETWKYGKYAVLPLPVSLTQNIQSRRKEQKKQEEHAQAYTSPYKNSQENDAKHQTQNTQKPPAKLTKITKSVIKPSNWFITPNTPKNVYKAVLKPSYSSLNTRLGRRFGNAASPRQLGNRAAKKIGSQIGKTVVKQAVLTFFKTPPGWITLGVIALIFLFFGAMFMITTTLSGGGSGGGSQVGGGSPIGGTPQQPNNPISGLTLTLSALSSVPNSEDIVYTVRVSYDEALLPAPVDDIEIVNIIPTTTRFVETTGVPSSTTGGAIVWPLSSSANRSEFTFTLSPVQDDIIVNNSIYAILASNQSLGGANPTTTNCNGAYSLDNPIGNFGDPDCFFAENDAQAKSELYSLLQKQDPSNAYEWYLKVVPCESVPPYNPNSHSTQAQINSPDPAGVWGLFSMGRGLNGEYDHGDVAWRQQVSNAINYGKLLTSNGLALGEYWECWR